MPTTEVPPGAMSYLVGSVPAIGINPSGVQVPAKVPAAAPPPPDPGVIVSSGMNPAGYVGFGGALGNPAGYSA